MTAEPMSGKQAADGAMEFPISAEDAGARLDKWLSERIESLTHAPQGDDRGRRARP